MVMDPGGCRQTALAVLHRRVNGVILNDGAAKKIDTNMLEEDTHQIGALNATLSGFEYQG